MLGNPQLVPTSPRTPLREHCIGVEWLRTFDTKDAVRAAYRRPTACRIRDPELVRDLIDAFGLTGEWSVAQSTTGDRAGRLIS